MEDADRCGNLGAGVDLHLGRHDHRVTGANAGNEHRRTGTKRNAVGDADLHERPADEARKIDVELSLLQGTTGGTDQQPGAARLNRIGGLCGGGVRDRQAKKRGGKCAGHGIGLLDTG